MRLSALGAACLATAAASIVAAIMMVFALGQDDPAYILRWAISPIGLIAFPQMVLAGPPIAKWVFGRTPLNWANAATLGLLVGGLPSAIVLVVLAPLRAAFGHPLPLLDWTASVIGLGLAGMVGGLIFRALVGEGRSL
ncbi:hypothetical protein [Sphingomonas sp. KR3-1]|uniref:hypothetical protein n=1 Tax=Sphingomonas sp. KR3-1 TaxID=3156611 RepID=UPI0032B62591